MRARRDGLTIRIGDRFLWFHNVGVQFPYRGDEVIWIWPWARASGQPWLSIGCEGAFPSLAAIDAF